MDFIVALEESNNKNNKRYNKNMINDMVVREGEIWAIDTNNMHSAENSHSTLPSLHFVIDYME